MEEDRSKKFSPSKLGVYEDCPLRYRYRYIDKIERPGRTVEAFLGVCVHGAFEALYEGLLGGHRMSLPETLQVYDKLWKKDWGADVRLPERSPSPEEWRMLGRECVRSYYESHEPFDSDRTVGVEKRVGFPIESGGEEYRIEGFVDRLSLGPDGAFEIHDYKTGKTLPTQEEVDQDRQLAIYDLAVRHAWPDTKDVRLVWHYVRHGKTLKSSRTDAQREALKKEIADLIQGIKSDHEFLPRASPLCGWCEYRDICPLWSHAEKVEAMKPEAASKEEGVRLVGELARLEKQKQGLREDVRALDREEEAVKEALARYAETSGHAVVFGAEGQAAITVKDEIKLPTKTHAPEEFKEFEKELKALSVWPEISHPDVHALLEGLYEKKWPESVLVAVERVVARHGKRVKETTVRFRKKKEDPEG